MFSTRGVKDASGPSSNVSATALEGRRDRQRVSIQKLELTRKIAHAKSAVVATRVPVPAIQDAGGETNAKLKVSFFWPFRGDYWIIELGKDYEYAVVAGPGRDYLWILARRSTMDQSLYDAIVGRLKDQGFDIAKLRLTEHRSSID